MMQCKAISFSTLTLASVHRLCLKWEGSERSGQPGQWHRDRLHGVAKEREGAASTETHERPRSERCLLRTVFFFTSHSMHQFVLHDVIYLVLYSALIKADSMVLAQWLQRCTSPYSYKHARPVRRKVAEKQKYPTLPDLLPVLRVYFSLSRLRMGA